MKMLRRSGIAALAFLALVSAAGAIQLGTSGTDKSHQQQGMRLGVLECLNNAATASSGAATLNAVGLLPTACGVVTSESLTTAAAATYTLTLTNNMIAAGDIVLATVQLGSSTTGMPAIATVTTGAGSVVIVVQNIHASASLNGTIKISYILVKLSKTDSD
jgi:hypothetical protein